MFSPCKLPVSATSQQIPNNEICFVYSNRLFYYNLDKNIKTCSVFSVEFASNKYNRFGSVADRQTLLKNMLNLGFDIEIALNYLFPNLNAKIAEIEKNINIKPINAKLTINTNSEQVFKIKPEVVGYCVDKQKIYLDICHLFLLNKPLKIQISTTKLLPEIFANDLKKATHLRADFSTSIKNSSTDRKHNVKNALIRLNKTEIAPNEIFSFNKTIGKRTKENGYREAKIIVNNEFVEGLGGGVCQVSSTLYNSALLAGLEIIEANKHSKQVGYVKYGFDAMVNFGSSDLKFKNNTNEKITIITNYYPDSLRIRIYGENLNQVEYRLSNEIVSTTEPIELVQFDTENKFADKVLYEDESFYLKKATKGMEIKSYREKYVNGQLFDKQLLRFDKFKVQDAIKVYGTKKRTTTDAQIEQMVKT